MKNFKTNLFLSLSIFISYVDATDYAMLHLITMLVVKVLTKF
jgi:hypothetical protein